MSPKILNVSSRTFHEFLAKLRADPEAWGHEAGRYIDDPDGPIINLNGLAIRIGPSPIDRATDNND